MRDRAAQDEAPRLDARDLVDLRTGPGMHKLVDRAAERTRIRQQRGDVAKQDARFRIVPNGADGCLQIVIKGHSKILAFLRPSFRGAGYGPRKRGQMASNPESRDSGFASMRRPGMTGTTF